MSETPGNLALGACGVPNDAYLTGYYLGMELRALGINMNYAPNLDIYSNPLASAVGPRGFSSDPVQVGMMGLAYYKGMASTGIICTAKHFPGHGGSVTDSHGFLPVVDISYEGLWQRELVPYRFLVKEGVPAIMSCHVAFPQVSGEKIPASLSATLLRDILRDKLEFRGIVITDDLEMYGVRADGSDMPTVCLKAIEAGNDAVLISHTPAKQEKSWQQLRKLIKEDDNFCQLVIEAVRRILRIKMKFFKGENAFPILPDVEAVKNSIPAKYAPQFFLGNACRSVTVIRNQDLPLKPKAKEKIFIVSNYYGFLREGRKRYPQAKIFYIRDFSSDNESNLIKSAAAFDKIIYCLGNKRALAILKKMKHLENKLVIISILTPVYLMEVPWVRNAIAVYGESDDTFKAGFAVLAGDFQAEGEMPLDFFKEQAGE
jgi:beta-N-acetylhexosaminidase